MVPANFPYRWYHEVVPYDELVSTVREREPFVTDHRTLGMRDLLQRVVWRLPDDFSPTWRYEASVDVLILGSGIQGLCHLDTLAEQGYSTALVAEEPIGEGSTRQWNGVLDAGYDTPDPANRATVDDHWIPYVETNEIEAEREMFVLAKDRAFDRLKTAWSESTYPFEEASPQDVPVEWQEGELFADDEDHKVSTIQEYTVSKPDLVSSFVADHGSRIVQGEIVDVSCSREDGKIRIEAVEIDLDGGGTARIEANHVVLAAGGLTPITLESLVETEGFENPEGETGLFEEVCESIRVRTEHLLAIRAPRGALPEACVRVLPRNVTVAVQREQQTEGVGRVTWYVTSESFTSNDDEEPESVGRIDPLKVGTGFSEIFSLVPAVRERAERENSGIEFGVFAGAVPDLGAETTHTVVPLDDVSNLIVSVSDPATAWLAAEEVAEVFPDSSDGRETWVPADVGIDDIPSPSAGTQWLDWGELIVRYAEADPVWDDATTTRGAS